MQSEQKIGWTGIAPPLTDTLLEEYRGTVATVPTGTPLRDALDSLLACVSAWWELPESKLTSDRTWMVGTKLVREQPLEPHHVTQLDPLVPWEHELSALTGFTSPSDGRFVPGLFTPIPPGAVQKAAFHLAWFAIELCRGREPITLDKL